MQCAVGICYHCGLERVGTDGPDRGAFLIDRAARQLKRKAYRPLVTVFARQSPLALTAVAFGFGLAAAGLAWGRLYGWAAAAWFLNRLFDGLDGEVARRRGIQSDLGGYVDIVADFGIYFAVPFSIVLGRNESALWLPLVLLLGSFYVNGASWMYLSALLEKRGQAEAGTTSVTMPVAIVEGLETILFFFAFLVFPQFAGPLMVVMAALVFIGIGQRLLWARRHLD